MDKSVEEYKNKVFPYRPVRSSHTFQTLQPRNNLHFFNNCFYICYVKIFFAILSCFTLYLSMLPCGDSIECNVKQEVKISAADNHGEHDHAEEICTPFCTCSCCAVSVYYSGLSKIQTPNVFQSVKHPVPAIAYNPEVYYAIWQPPKIS